MVEIPARSPSYAVPALEKGLDILECLSRRRVPMTQAQIARELGRGPGELFRMLTVLERRGYLRRDPVSGTYDLTLRLYELGQTHSPYDYLVRTARLPMRELALAISQSCHLGVVEHGHLIVLHREESVNRVRLSVAVGSTIPALESVSGRLLLAHMAEDERMEMLEHETGYPSLSQRERDRLLERFETIREHGYDTARSEQTEGVTDIAVLIGTLASRTRASLAIPALARDHGTFVGEALPAIRRCATLIGQAAGIHEPAGSAPDGQTADD